jgi:hypothetical protein
MAEIAADMRKGLLALAVGAGLQVMQSLMEEDVAACCWVHPTALPRPGWPVNAAGSEPQCVLRAPDA